MPSEAINLRLQVVQSPALLKVWRRGTLISSTDVSMTSYADRSEYLDKPATVINPVRDDGTRAMSAYATTWFRGQNPGTVSGDQPFGNFTYEYVGYPRVLIRNATVGGTWASLVAGWRQVSPSDVLACDQEARTKTLNKLSQKKWDLGVTALELRQTAGLVTDLAQSMSKTLLSMLEAHKRQKQVIHRFFRSVQRHGDFYRAAAEVGLRDISLLEDLRDRWMQYQFGIKPLVNDSYSAAEALSHLLYQDGYPLLAVAKAGAERRARIRLIGPNVDPFERVYFGDAEVRVHYSVVYEIPLGTTGPINVLGLDNPASLLWEGTRLSWMWDYVVDIGGWLSSLTATNGMIFREGCRSELQRCTFHTSRVQSYANTTFTVRSKAESPMYVESGKFERTLIGPSGLLPAMVPSIRNDLGLTQLGNSLFALSHIMSGGAGVR